MTTVNVTSNTSTNTSTSWKDIPDGETFSGTVGSVTGHFFKSRLGIIVLEGTSTDSTPIRPFRNSWEMMYSLSYPVKNYSPMNVSISITPRSPSVK